MEVEKRIHKGYKEWVDANKRSIDIRKLFGKYQYICSSEKGTISLVEIS